MGFLAGKKALIVGLATDRSIAFGIAQALFDQGAELALTFQNERLEKSVRKLAENWNCRVVIPCDVASDEQIKQAFTQIQQSWDQIDILVHSVAFAPMEQLQGDYLENVTREGFKIAHDISAYSFSALAKAALPLLSERASLLTLSYLGAERVVANYNVMGLAKASLEANVRYMANSLGPQGIRVNAISAGPIRTLAASGIKNLRKMLQYHEQVAPLRSNTTIEQVGNAAAFLCSDLAAGITGEILHVDGGYHMMATSECMFAGSE